MFPGGYRRSTIEIVADILRLGEASEIEIKHNAHMSYFQLAKYLNNLLELQLLDRVMIDRQLVTYKVTEKGAKLLTEIDNMLEMLAGEEPLDI